MDTTPRLGDSDNNLLFKIAQSLIDGAVSGITQVAADARYVLKAGDTITGTLVAQTITSSTGGFVMNTTDSATTFAYQFLIQKRGTTGDATAAVTNNSELGTFSFRAWNGAAYATCAQIIGRAGEDQSSGHAGGFLQFATVPVAGSSAFVRMLVSPQGNLILGNALTPEPASLLGGVVFKDGTAASADPTTGSALWSASGLLQYRTSGSNEGSGQNNNLHNRAAQQAGVGSNYSETNSSAQVAFGTTNASVTLPTAGTYLVTANVSIINGATADDIYNAKLRNTTDSADVGVNKKVSGGPASGRVNIFLSEIVTVTAASKVITIFSHNETGARGTVESTTTDIRYIRLS